MTIWIDRELCNGCGSCIEACPNRAVFLVAGKAAIDEALCTQCETCISLCPVEAIQRSTQPLTLERKPTPEIKVLKPVPMATPHPRRAEWLGSVLAVLGQQVLPFMLDRWMETLEHRSVTPTAIAKVSQPQMIKSYRPGRAARATPLHRRRRFRKGRNL